MEIFLNNARSSLVSAIGPSDTTFTVSSAATFSGLTAGNQARVKIDDEIILVFGSGLSGAVFSGVTRGIEGTTAVSHAANASVVANVTAGGLVQGIDDRSLALAEVVGAASTVITSDLTASRAVVSNGSGKIAASATTAAELGFVSGLTSAVQTQLNSKAATSSLSTVATSGAYSDLTGKPTLGTAAALDVGITANKVVQLNGSAQLPAVDGSLLTGIVTSVTANRAVASDGSGHLTASGTSATELGYVSGVTSAIQTQLNTKAATSSLATVATSGAYNDLTGKPTLGTAAALDVGTTANKVAQLDASANLVSVQKVIARQSGGVAGTDEIQLSHDGTRGFVASKDGAVRLTTTSGSGNVIEAYRQDTVDSGFSVTTTGSATMTQAVIAGVTGCLVDTLGMIRMGSGSGLKFYSSGWNGSEDLGVTRSAAGTLKITNGSSGFGDLLCANMQGQLLYLASPGTGNVPIQVIAAIGQTGSLQEWQDQSGNPIAKIAANGHISSSTALGSDLIADYSNNRTYIWLNKDSTHACLVQGLQSDRTPFSIRGAASMSTTLFEVQDDSATVLVSIDQTGRLVGQRIEGTLAVFDSAEINSQSPSQIVLAVKAAADQSANLQEWQNSSGTALSQVGLSGIIYAPSFVSTVSSGTSPIAVASDTLVDNLNAQYLNGKADTDFVDATSPYANKPAYSQGSISGAFAFDYSNGRHQIIELNGNVTSFSFTNPPSCTTPATLTIHNPAAHTWDWSSAVKWPGGTVPTVTTSGVDIFTFIYDSSVSDYYGTAAQAFS